MMKDLIALYMQPTHEQKCIAKLRNIIIDALEGTGYIADIDEAGNMFMYHPESTCKTLLCAHMDMVKTGEPISRIIQVNDCVLGLDKEDNLTSCGADDKNGVWLLIQAAKHSNAKPSLLFVAHEEGAPHTIDDWIDEFGDLLGDYDNCLVMDRAGGNEIIYKGSMNDYSALLACQWKKCNPEWEFHAGVMCDADRLIKHIPCINLSIGYYRGHSEDEYTLLNELFGVRDALIKFIDTPEEIRNVIDWNVIKEFNTKEKKGL